MSENKKTYSLRFNEQACLVQILNGFKGSITDLTYVLEDMKAIRITEDEFKALDAKDHIDPRTGQKTGITSWDEEKANELGEREFALSTVAVEFAKTNIEERSKKGLLTLRDAETLALRKKLQ